MGVSGAGTVESYRRDALRAIGPSPLLTYYDLNSGERVELSHRTTDNWVAKTANLLVDNGIGASDRVALVLPVHWQRAIWSLAIWRVGATVVSPVHAPLTLNPDEIPEPHVADSDLVVRGPHPLSQSVNVDVIACSLRPLGLPFESSPADGAIDYALDVRGQPDLFSGPVPSPASVALDFGDEVLTHLELVQRADEWANGHNAHTGVRLMVSEPGPTPSPTDSMGLELVLAIALARNGSIVITRGGNEAQRRQMADDERVTTLSDDG